MASAENTSPGRQSGLPVALREAGLVLLVAVLATGVWWLRNPDRLPLRADPTVYERELEAPLLAIPAALAAYQEGVQLFVDTRPDAVRTIPGAIRVREDTFDDDLQANFDFLLPEDQLILFGDGSLSAASNIAGRLHERGFANIVILEGGLAAWREAGGELTTIPAGSES